MTNKEFTAYVFEQRRQGMSDSQIARSLGMSLAHFIGKLNEIEKQEGRGTLNASPVEKPKKDKKPVVKPVSGAEQPKEPVVEEPEIIPVTVAEPEAAAPEKITEMKAEPETEE